MLIHRAAKPQGNEMSAGRTCAALIVAASVTSTAVIAASTASATDQQWSGRYTIVSYASQKGGTSVAARQPESDFSAEFVFVTDCSSGKCVAAALDGPEPTNPSVPRPQQFTWTGTHWVYVYDWNWDCFQGDGIPMEWSPARSWTIYAPQPDGSLRGTWHTDIASGVCRGSVVWPVAAYPAPPR